MASFELTFLGGAGTVTGSKTLIECNGHRVLVDCGLFQGLKELRALNRLPFPVDASSIDAIILTHAHLDHCGYIPVLVKHGFKGLIHCTHPTADLTGIILSDSAKIQEEDAERANSHGYSKHAKAEPLYAVGDVITTMKQVVSHDLHEWVVLSNDIKFQFLNSGHILGSAFADVHVAGKKILFTGDIGRTDPLLLYPPKKVKQADFIVMESTYGDREHGEEDVKKALLNVIRETYDRRGILMIPSFAVERTQELIYFLYQLQQDEALPDMPIYLDSPMGIDSTKVYMDYLEWQNIPRFELKQMYDPVQFINDYEQSRAVVLNQQPKIVLAGSGMIEGGRILHYLNNHIDDPKNTLLFVGYQGEGTRGRAIMEGKEDIKFFGEYRKVRCQIRSISSLSAHGDRSEMVDWLRHFELQPETIFLNHGEKYQTEALKTIIEHELGWNVTIPELNSHYTLR